MGRARLRDARGLFKVPFEIMLVPESPRGNGSWDDASTLQSDHNCSFPMFPGKWEDRWTGGCVFLPHTTEENHQNSSR